MNDVVQFIDQNIKLNEKAEGWSLTKHQRAVLVVMYARYFVIRLWSEIKKSGKTFLAGCIAVKEAVTRSDAEVVCVANDEEQAQSRVFATCVALCDKNPELKASVVKVTQNEIRFSNGSVIRAVASDYKGAAGGRQVLTVFDELWAYDSERMTRLFEEMRPPPTEKEAYILIVSYAGYSGESTVLEKLYERGLKGKRLSWRYEVYAEAGLVMFWSHVGRMPWHTKRYFAEEEKGVRPNTFRRLHRNEWVSSESSFITSDMWDAVVDQSHTPILSGATIFVGVDIGVKHDSTGIVGVCWNETGKKIKIACHKVWKPTRTEQVPLQGVEDYLLELSQSHHIVKIFADPSQCLGLIQRLQNRLPIEEYKQTQDSTVVMGEALFRSVGDKNLIAYPSADLREHVTNAIGQESARGVRMVKDKASKKIDLAIALSMALVAALKSPRTIDLSGFWAGGQRGINPKLAWEDQWNNDGPSLGDDPYLNKIERWVR